MREDLDRDGALVVEDVIDPDNLQVYLELYQRILTMDIDASNHRHDLGSHLDAQAGSDPDTEKVCQVMWPSLYFNFEDGPLHKRTAALARALLGDDVVFDFDHLIYKAPFNDTPFPWHQDEGYWRSGMPGVEFSDLRATSIWCAMDHADEQNGCMWMVPGSHKMGLFEHRPVKEGHHTDCRLRHAATFHSITPNITHS